MTLLEMDGGLNGVLFLNQNAAEISHVALINPSTHFTAALLCIETCHFYAHEQKCRGVRTQMQIHLNKDALQKMIFGWITLHLKIFSFIHI